MALSDLDALKARCAAALGWSERDVRGVSLAALRELVRARHPKLAAEITEILRRGAYLSR
jgi:hypothetical protein